MKLRRALRRGRASSWLGIVAAAVLFFGGQATRSLHWLLVPHRLCQVHGEWEHLAEHGDGAAPAKAPAYRTAEKPHEFCSLSSTWRQEPPVSVATEDRVGSVAPERALTLRHTADAPPQIALLLLAPKHSPPA